MIAEDSVVGLQVDTPVSTEDAQVEDDVEARVTRDVVVDDEIAIPAGTRVLGSVVLVEGAGELRGAARLGVRFHTIVLDEVFELPIVTETVYREGKGRGARALQRSVGRRWAVPSLERSLADGRVRPLVERRGQRVALRQPWGAMASPQHCPRARP